MFLFSSNIYPSLSSLLRQEVKLKDVVVKQSGLKNSFHFVK